MPAKSSQTTVLFHEDEYEYLKRTAAERRVSIGQVIRESVRFFMSRDSANTTSAPVSDAVADAAAG